MWVVCSSIGSSKKSSKGPRYVVKRFQKYRHIGSKEKINSQAGEGRVAECRRATSRRVILPFQRQL
jgi:hypothetical protein